MSQEPCTLFCPRSSGFHADAGPARYLPVANRQIRDRVLTVVEPWLCSVTPKGPVIDRRRLPPVAEWRAAAAWRSTWRIDAGHDRGSLPGLFLRPARRRWPSPRNSAQSAALRARRLRLTRPLWSTMTCAKCREHGDVWCRGQQRQDAAALHMRAIPPISVRRGSTTISLAALAQVASSGERRTPDGRRRGWRRSPITTSVCSTEVEILGARPRCRRWWQRTVSRSASGQTAGARVVDICWCRNRRGSASAPDRSLHCWQRDEVIPPIAIAAVFGLDTL